METYRPRHIRFKKLISVQEWKVKLYTISEDEKMESPAIESAAVAKLPEWLEMKNSFNSDHDLIAFLIIHQGKEGVFFLINWWVGKNMLNTHIFLSPHQEIEQFEKISGDGLSPCTWELEIIDHERRAWIEHVLKRPSSPDFDRYLAASFNGTL